MVNELQRKPAPKDRSDAVAIVDGAPLPPLGAAADNALLIGRIYREDMT